MQLQFIISIWMLIITLGQSLTPKFINQEDDTVIMIDKDGANDLECCTFGNCHCSNLSLALQHIQDNTEVKVQSNISLHDIITFGNVSSVKITGNNSPTVRCDHQGGLVGKNINYILIQGMTWDTCNGITIINFTDEAHVTECNFLNFNSFALTLHGLGSAIINGCTFSRNEGSIDVSASFITIYGSKFYNSKSASLFINFSNLNDNLVYHGMINTTIESCKFTGNSGHSVHCIGSVGVVPPLSILSSNFTNNTNTAVNVEHCNITLNKVTFSSNVNADSGHVNDGGAVRIYNGTINMTGNVLFYHNRAGNNGGAVYLNHSVIVASEGSILFCSNTASNGGAIFIGEDSKLSVETSLNFLDNDATYNGGILYIDLYLINDAAVIHRVGSYYYNLLNHYTDSNHGNIADVGNWAYFNFPFLDMCFPVVYHINLSNRFTSSSPCRIDSYYDNSTVFGNITNTDINGGLLEFWLHDLNIFVIIADHFGNDMGPVNASFWCCNNDPLSPYNCTIDSRIGSFKVTSENRIIKCPSTDTFRCNVIVSNHKHCLVSSDIDVMVKKSVHNCNDIAHVFYDGGCLPICIDHSWQKHCLRWIILPGYWYDNGITRYVSTCPIGHCNQYIIDYLYNGVYPYHAHTSFPDRDLQCTKHWRGLACGECNYSDGYAIEYDTTKCVPVDKCLTTSIPYSLIFLFGASLFYWIAVISFIFVLLHFKFDITAGYAYGLLFYYSVLELLVNNITNYLARNFLDIPYRFSIYGHDLIYHEVMRLKVLPFLSNIGNLKLPFAAFMKLCFGEAKMIDHIILGYIHPLIVTFMIVIVYILARNFVLVARTIGRYVNSKSICILLLLSYSSVTYTSMQLLKPLPLFYYDGSVTTLVYWSPTVKYFHGRHLWYGIIAILCEVIIGIGLPLVLIFQRYLFHYCNINFTSLKPILDQLMGCYKEEYRWFAAYYLICRQALYGIDNLTGYFSEFQITNGIIIDTALSEFTITLTVCIFITLIHVWFQPYKSKSLNILDSFILLTLVSLLLSSLQIYLDAIIAVVFWFLPLLILINYLSYFTKLKHLIIPCSCAAVFSTTLCLPGYLGIFALLFLATSLTMFIVYIICVIKCLCTRYRKTRLRYSAINEQERDDDVDETYNTNITEVHDW